MTRVHPGSDSVIPHCSGTQGKPERTGTAGDHHVYPRSLHRCLGSATNASARLHVGDDGQSDILFLKTALVRFSAGPVPKPPHVSVHELPNVLTLCRLLQGHARCAREGPRCDDSEVGHVHTLLREALFSFLVHLLYSQRPQCRELAHTNVHVLQDATRLCLLVTCTCAPSFVQTCT